MRSVLVLVAGVSVQEVGCLLERAGLREERARAGYAIDVEWVDASSRSSTNMGKRTERRVRLRSVNLGTAAQIVRDALDSRRDQGTRIILVGPKPRSPSCRRAIVSAIREGAQDFVSRDSLKTEFLLRIEALGARDAYQRSSSKRSRFRLALEEHTGLLRLGSASITLTPTECRLFSLLASRIGTVVPREILRRTCAGASPKTNALDVYILYLRKKLAILGSPWSIRTMRGVGYGLIEFAKEPNPQKLTVNGYAHVQPIDVMS